MRHWTGLLLFLGGAWLAYAGLAHRRSVLAARVRDAWRRRAIPRGARSATGLRPSFSWGSLTSGLG
jgi:hypothetical protein